MSIDASGIHQLAGAFRSVNIVPEVRQVVSKGALKVKNQLQSEAQGSKHFGRIVETVNYDLDVGGDFVEAEIGPDKSVMTQRSKSRGNRSGSDGSAASLAGIAYFGGSRGGGNTLPDPLIALRAEEPFVLSAIGDLLEDVLD